MRIVLTLETTSVPNISVGPAAAQPYEGSSSLVNTNCISNFVYYGIPIKKIRKREIYDDYLNS